MRCADARRKLSALLDRAAEASVRDAVLHHVEGCGPCRAELDALERTDATLRAALESGAETVPPGYAEGFWPRLAARLEREQTGDDLADIRALAAATLERQAEQASPEPAPLLVAPAPVSLGQVVLPPPSPRRRWAVWVVGLSAGVAAAAAVAVWVLAPRPVKVVAIATRPAPVPERLPEPPPAPEPPPTPAPVAAAPAPAPVRRERAAPALASPPTPAREERGAGDILGELTQPPAAAPALTGRQKLVESEIIAGMDTIEAKVQACYDHLKVAGRVTLRVRILPAGAVGAVDVTGRFAGTETGACVAEAVKQARFAPFDGTAMGINYAFQLEEE